MSSTNADQPSKAGWWNNLAVIQSIELVSVAAEVNARRLRDLRARLDGPLDDRQRKKMSRVLARHQAGTLHELPSDLAANADRMRQVLIAIFRKLGARPTWSFKVLQLAEEFGLKESTVRRGILDLEAACLVEVTRKTNQWKGGKTASNYRLVWPNLRDLAASQGVQGRLFDPERGADGPVRAEGFRPVEPVGRDPGERNTTSHGEEQSTHRGRSTSHHDRSITHGGEATSHGGRSPHARPRTHASSFFSFPHSPQSSPPSKREEEVGPCLIRTDGRRKASEPCDRPEWGRVRSRLVHLLAAWPKAINVAAERGWSPDQAERLVETFEGKTVGEVRAWSVGILYWQLTNGLPGSSINLPPCEAYVRAARDARLDSERKLAAQSASRQTETRTAAAAELDQLDERFGPTLDALSGEPLEQLVRSAIPGRPSQRHCMNARQAREGAKPFGMYRILLLKALAGQERHAPSALSLCPTEEA